MVSKTAERQMKLATQATEMADISAKLADLPATIDPAALLLLVSGPGDARGLLAVSLPVLAALIERRTTGHVGSAEIPARRATRTDAAIAAGFFDPVLEALSGGLSQVPRSSWAGGYRIEGPADDMRSVLLRLEDTTFRGARLAVTLTEGGSRTGSIVLLVPDLPDQHPDARQLGHATPNHPVAAQRNVPGGDPGPWSSRMEAAVLSVPAEVTGALWRLSMPLGELLALRPGTTIALPRDAVDRVPLEGSDGQVLARGRLGQSRGYRALRLRIGGGDADAGAASALEPGADDAPSESYPNGMPAPDMGQPLRGLPLAPAMMGATALPDIDTDPGHGAIPGEFAFGPV